LRNSVIKVLKKEKVSGSLLDVGCGPGWFLMDVHRAFPDMSLTGCDLSERMVWHATKNLELKAEIITGDAQNLPFPDNSFDAVTSTLAFHHFPEPVKAITEFHRVLKPSGLMVIEDGRRDCNAFTLGFIRFVTKFIVPKPLRSTNEPLGSLLASFTLDECKQIMEQSPFEKWSVSGGSSQILITARK
jgi:ubiquinone/menaquinone biosynthesis C-methylase UbiE